MTNMTHTRIVAANHGVLHLYPDIHITKGDAAMAIVATSYAIENLYAHKTLQTKTYAGSAFVIQDHKQHPFTSMVIKGIKAIRTIEKPLGVVMGKDVLRIFNKALQPEKLYYDLLLVTFD